MWKIQLTMVVNFISSIDDNDEECAMHSKSDNIEIIIKDKAGEVIEKLFDSLIRKYQIGLEKSMRGTDFIFDCVHLLSYKCHKINLSRGRLYIDSLYWIKIKSNNKSYQ